MCLDLPVEELSLTQHADKAQTKVSYSKPTTSLEGKFQTDKQAQGDKYQSAVGFVNVTNVETASDESTTNINNSHVLTSEKRSTAEPDKQLVAPTTHQQILDKPNDENKLITQLNDTNSQTVSSSSKKVPGETTSNQTKQTNNQASKQSSKPAITNANKISNTTQSNSKSTTASLLMKHLDDFF